MKIIKNEFGYTLIELIISLAVFTVISGILCASFVSTDKFKLNHDALKLQSNLRLCQRLAMAEYQPCQISFNINNNYYVIKLSGDNGFNETVYFSSGVKLESVTCAEKNVIYTQNGTVDGAGTIKLKAGNYSKELTILVSTGRVKIE